jgi:hypothetical protein
MERFGISLFRACGRTKSCKKLSGKSRWTFGRLHERALHQARIIDAIIALDTHARRRWQSMGLTADNLWGVACRPNFCALKVYESRGRR